MSDPIAELNLEAVQNIARMPHKTEPLTLFGEYNFIPIPLNRQEKIQASLTEINRIVNPTVRKLENPANIMEIQDKLYRKITPLENELNSCVLLSKNVSDVNYCSDRFVDQMNTVVKPYVLDFIRDF